jgi:Lrp/AsnC family transcriptional regulator of ectoine degradation
MAWEVDVLKLDRIDLNILSTLQSEGRITQYRLASLVGLSPSACHQRLKQLEAMRLVRGYYAEVDIDRLVTTLTAFVPIELSVHERGNLQDFEAAVAQRVEVLECYAIGGGFGYMLKVIAPDIAAYQAFIDELLASDLGIVRYQTYIVTKLVKQRHGYPLHQLLRARSGVLPAPAAPAGRPTAAAAAAARRVLG